MPSPAPKIITYSTFDSPRSYLTLLIHRLNSFPHNSPPLPKPCPRDRTHYTACFCRNIGSVLFGSYISLDRYSLFTSASRRLLYYKDRRDYHCVGILIARSEKGRVAPPHVCEHGSAVTKSMENEPAGPPTTAPPLLSEGCARVVLAVFCHNKYICVSA